MSSNPKKFYLTTPIYYVNARPHIGHAYTTIVADVLARRHRLLGDDTFFLTGTDEHGQKIERSAAAAGIPPQQFTDQVAAEFKSLWDRMGITYDKFIRTTSPEHAEGVQKLWRELEARGFIYLSSYTGSYCVSDEAFVDAPAGTPCPDCGRLLETVTEENYFFKLSEFQLPLLNLIESGELKIENESRRNEVLSFLRGNLNGSVLPGVEGGFSPPSRPAIEQALASGLATTAAGTPYLPGALKDLSISRSSFKWGIPVPGNDKHVIYVWLDALANYITALGYGSDDTTNFEKFWPADLHLVGKEIIRFHCVYWPAFLMAAGIDLPKAITAHGWLLFDNSKMSKSKGNIVRTETILDAFGTLCPPSPDGAGLSGVAAGFSPRKDESFQKRALDSTGLQSGESDARADGALAPGTRLSGVAAGFSPREATTKENGALAPGTANPQDTTNRRGTASAVPSQTPLESALAAEVGLATQKDRDLFASDILRYFLLREIPFGQDGSFSFDALITRYNADLANGYGNLVSRTLKMIEQYCDGRIPAEGKVPWTPFADPMMSWDWETLYRVDHRTYSPEENLLEKESTFDFSRTIALLSAGVALCDSTLTHTAPWKLVKNPLEKETVDGILYEIAEAIHIITALLHPIMPFATAKVWAQLGLGDIEEAAKAGKLTKLHRGQLKPGTKLGPLSPIFPRADKSLIEIMTNMENENALATGNSKLATESTTRTHPEQPLKSATTPAHFTPEALDPTDPAAPPRAFTEPDSGTHVAGSAAIATERSGTPSHKEAPASGAFATVASQTPITASPSDAAPHITIDDFAKVELRIAQVIVAERIPKADKLLRLEVDLGPDMPRRQILSGIAEHYAPEDLLGRRIIVITNLAPRKMRGLESHGMLLAASEEGGKPFLATVPEGVPLGTRLK